MTTLGLAALDLYDAIPFGAENERSYLTKTLDYLEEHFVGKCNVIYERFVFNSRLHGGETFTQYLTSLRK